MITEIDRLLESYFEGKTSVAEEKMIRHYFAHHNLDDDLKEYVSLFRFLENESEAKAVLNEIRHGSDASVPQRQPTGRYWAMAAIAASLLIALVLLSPDKQSTTQNGNYVWVDGKRMSDPLTVMKYAELSFGKVHPESDIIEDQLCFVLE
ncbi:MAG: hypothetical protein JJE08_08360 [Proteiniphilum sp.]|nr:hypothetical protein [Proteiniphilum sp.]